MSADGARTIFGTFFGGAGGPAGHVLSEFNCRLEPSEPIALIADGDSLAFQVYFVYQWRGHAESREELRDRAETLMPRARRIVTQWFRPLARAYPPHQARELEAEINKRCEDYWCRLTDGDQEIRFALTARVEPDEAVRDQMRPYWAARIKAECDHELGMQRARQAEELTRYWSRIFDQLERDPRAAYAAKLSEQEFAEVFRAFVDHREKALLDVVDLLKAAVNGHDDARLSPSDYTRAWDAAIRAFERQYGLRRDGS